MRQIECITPFSEIFLLYEWTILLGETTVRLESHHHFGSDRVYSVNLANGGVIGKYKLRTVLVSATEHGSSAGYSHCHRLGQNFPDFVHMRCDFVGIHSPKYCSFSLRIFYLLNITNWDRTQVFPTYEVFSRIQ